MNPTILGVIGPGFLNQVPTLQVSVSSRMLSIWKGLHFGILDGASIAKAKQTRSDLWTEQVGNKRRCAVHSLRVSLLKLDL